MSTELQHLFSLIDSYEEANIDLAFTLMAENAEWRAAYLAVKSGFPY